MKNKVVILVSIIILLIIALWVVGGLYLKEKENKASENNNYLIDLNNHYGMNMGTSLELNYAAKLINITNEESYYTDYNFSSFHIVYNYTGENMGKLFVDDKEININSGIIQDIRVGTEFDGYYFAVLEDGETYNFKSTLYILFKDGTIGKISTEDIKNEKYSVTMMPEYKDIEHFVEVEPTDSGADTILWAVNKNGNAHAIDVVRAGS